VSDADGLADAASRNLLRRVLWVALLFFGSISLFVALLYGHYKTSEYQATIPASATVDTCWRQRSGDLSCSGTWRINGQQYHGSIEGVVNLPPPGSVVDVRADRYRAFASAPWPYEFAVVVSALLAVAAIALFAWGRLRR
jgi:hypothetical protein